MSHVVALVILVVIGSEALAGPIIKTSCQKNEGDGRILVTDTKALPSEDATFKVLRYKATSHDGDWSEGPCTIQVTGHAS